MNAFETYASSGGDDGNRTHDPLLAGQVLSQLSYTPVLGLKGSVEIPETSTGLSKLDSVRFLDLRVSFSQEEALASLCVLTFLSDDRPKIESFALA